MSHLCKVKIKKVVYERPEICPFMSDEISLRELARRTGLDAGYLSRVMNGKVAITEERYTQLLLKSKGKSLIYDAHQ